MNAARREKLELAARVLGALAGPSAASAIAMKLAVPQATVTRVLAALSGAGLVVWTQPDRTSEFGWWARTHAGNAVVRTEARRRLDVLSRRFDEATPLA